MGSDVNGSVLGELEGVLSEQGWAGLVSAGHQGPGIEGVGAPEDVLETRRAGVADADTDRVGAAGGVRDQWSGIRDYAVLHVEAQEVMCVVAHHRTADRPPVLPGGEIPRWVSD